MEIQDYTDSEFKHALARNLRSLTRGKKSSKQPIAILLGGQSGAGKTTIHRIKQKEFQGNTIIIDGDAFRSQHTHYLELQQEYGKDKVRDMKYNFSSNHPSFRIYYLENGIKWRKRCLNLEKKD